MYRVARIRSKPLLIHLLRVGMLITIVVLIRWQHVWFVTQQRGQRATSIALDRVLQFFPSAVRLSDFDPEHGGQRVIDADGSDLGFVLQTSPESDSVIGYSGPSNTMVAFDTNATIVGIDPISSSDTPEHFAAVKAARSFLTSFDGLTWQQVALRDDVDGVAGATLTSLAIAEGIIRRLGGAPHSYRFPKPLELADARRFFSEAKRIVPSKKHQQAFDVLGGDDGLLGTIARTSPTADDLIGYQGPTDTLVGWNREEAIVGIAIRASYDNQPYVRYVAEDEYFLTLFNGQTVADLAALDLPAARIEGVSGATMTSVAMADALIKTSRVWKSKPTRPRRRTLVFTARDAGTIGVIIGGLMMAFTSLRGKKWIRIGFQILLIVYLGLINGDMISQALLVGWSQSGVPWRLAPGLAAMVAIAWIVPATTRRQVYCQHICPHGAIQQLLRNRLPWRLRLSRRMRSVLGYLPATLLGIVSLTALLHWDLNLASLEPFDAYFLTIAGAGTIIVAVAGLIASLFVPMAYCRYGCPTGAMLDYVRLNAKSDQLGKADLFAFAVVVFSVGVAIHDRWL